MKQIPALLTLLLTLNSCNPKLEFRDYINYFNNKANGVFSEADSSGAVAAIRTREYVVLKEIGEEIYNLNKEDVQKQIDSYEDCLYIYLKFPTFKNLNYQINDSLNNLKYITYLNSTLIKHLELQVGNNIFPCARLSIEPTSFANGITLIMTGFIIKPKDLNNPTKLIIRESEYHPKIILPFDKIENFDHPILKFDL
jgi:hypothetical protein